MAESATLQCHHSAEPQTERVPTHSLSTHTAAVADNTGKKGGMLRIRKALKQELETWTVWVRGALGLGFILDNIVLDSHLRFVALVLKFSIDNKSYMTFGWTRLVTYNHHFIKWLKWFEQTVLLLQKLLDQILQRSKNWMTDEDDDMTKPVAFITNWRSENCPLTVLRMTWNISVGHDIALVALWSQFGSLLWCHSIHFNLSLFFWKKIVLLKT